MNKEQILAWLKEAKAELESLNDDELSDTIAAIDEAIKSIEESEA